jgi:CubicO group peptidase (beta-lactamase class C family)
MNLKSLFPIAAVAALAACAAQPAIERTSPPGAADNLRLQSTEVLFWDNATRADRFRRMEDFFPGIEVAPSPQPRALPTGGALPAAAAAPLDAYLARGDVAGIMVLQHGQVRYEKYGLGFGPGQRWTSFSMAKSVTSTLVGAALKDGHIESLSDPVSRYVPGLKGSEYDAVTIEQLLTMTSGIAWNENYTDPNSDVARLFALEPDPGQSQVVTLMKRLPREAPAGEKWVYKTGETNLIGELVEKATGMTLAEYAKTEVVDPAGLAGRMFWQTELTGGNVGGCCLALSLADYARLGQFVLEGGKGSVSEGWFAEAGRPHVELGGGAGYGYQWWTYPAGAFGAIGIFGQSMTLFPSENVVVVILGNWPAATGPELTRPRTALLTQVYAAIAAE